MHLVINLTWWNNKQCSEEIPSLKTFKCPQSGLSRVESWEAQGKQWGKWDREKSRMNALTKKLVWRTARVPSCLGVGPPEEHWNKLQGCFTWGQANSSTFLLTPIMHRWRWSSETLLSRVTAPHYRIESDGGSKLPEWWRKACRQRRETDAGPLVRKQEFKKLVGNRL